MRPEDVASSGIKAAKVAGAAHAEAFVVKVRSLSAYVDDSKVKSVEEKSDLGVAMRVMVDGRIGQSSSSVSSLRQVEACARTAVQAASLVPRDKVFKGFAWPAKEQNRVRAWDPGVGSMSVDEMTEILKQVVASASESKRIKVPNGVLRAAELESVVANTNNLLTKREASLVYLMLTAMPAGPSPGEGLETF